MSKLREKLPKEGGFTIIEVVLVLAIAGLIFLIVFLALPQLQQSRRDTQRRSDAGRFLAALQNYSSNTNGNYPSFTQVNAPGWIAENVSSDAANVNNFNDPDGDNYDLVTAANRDEPGEFTYYVDASCADNGGEPTSPAGGDRDIAVIFELEGGEFCQDNQ